MKRRFCDTVARNAPLPKRSQVRLLLPTALPQPPAQPDAQHSSIPAALRMNARVVAEDVIWNCSAQREAI